MITLAFGLRNGNAQAPSIAYVQGNYAVPQTSQSRVTVAFTGAQTAGNANVIIAGWNDTTAHVQSVTDTMENVYVLAVGPTVNPAFGSQAIYYASNIRSASAGANVVSVVFSQPAVYPDIRIAEYQGLETTDPVDVTAAAKGNSTLSNSFAVTTTTGTDGVNRVELNLSATESTWLSITSEGKPIFSGILQPSQTKTLTGLEVAMLKVGNAGAVDVRWNGKPIGPIGPRGQVRVVRFTPENFQILGPSQTL